MRKGVSYFVVMLLIALGIVVLYYWGGEPTGMVVFEEYENSTACEAAGYFWENITNETCVNVTTCVNETYTYDCEPCLEYEVINETTNETECINWTVCISENQTCTTEENCTEVVVGGQCIGGVCDEEHLNLCEDETNCTEAGGYWYDNNDDGNSTCNEEAEPLEVTINEPSGAKEIDSGIPIEYIIIGGENVSLSCLYNVKRTSDDVIVITNTTLTDCGASSFDVPDEGDYLLTVYVEGSEKFAYDESSFSVSLPEESEESEEEGEEASSGSSSLNQVPVIPSYRLGVTELSDLSLTAGESQEITWSISSTGRNAVSECSVKPLGDYASWIVVSEDTLDINAGEEGVFAFSVSVPGEIAEGSYLLSVSVECAEVSATKDFTVEVSAPTAEEKEEGKGAPVGGFAIFTGIGAGGIIAFIIVLAALVFVFVFARRMRRSGKTLRDVFNQAKTKVMFFKK